MNRKLLIVLLCLAGGAAQAETFSYAGRSWVTVEPGREHNVRRNTDGSVRFEIRSGEICCTNGYTDPSTSERTEINDQATFSTTTAYRLDFQLKFDQSARITSKWMSLLQFKPAPGHNGPSPVHLQVVNNKIGAVLTLNNGSQVVKTMASEIVPGRTYQLRLETYIDYSLGSNGYARLWIDGVQVLNYSGQLGYSGKTGSNLRFGIYRAAAPETVIMNLMGLNIQTGARGTNFPDPTGGAAPQATTPSAPAPSPSPAPAPAPAPSAPGGVITLNNPGFENGLTGWSNWGGLTTSSAHSGSFAASVPPVGGIGQNVLSKLVVGRSYRLTFYGKTSAAGETTGVAGISFKNNGTRILEKDVPVTSSSYQQYSVDFVVPSGATEGVVFAWKDPGAAPVEVDDFALAEMSSVQPSSGSGVLGAPAVSGIFTNRSFASQSSNFSVRFDAVPSAASVDVVMGLTNGSSATYDNYSAMVRFNRSGRIDAGDGSQFGYAAQSAISYAAGVRYSFRLSVNMSNMTYSAYVSAPGQAEQAILINTPFRRKVSPLNNLMWAQGLGSASLSGFSISAP